MFCSARACAMRCRDVSWFVTCASHWAVEPIFGVLVLGGVHVVSRDVMFHQYQRLCLSLHGARHPEWSGGLGGFAPAGSWLGDISSCDGADTLTCIRWPSRVLAGSCTGTRWPFGACATICCPARTPGVTVKTTTVMLCARGERRPYPASSGRRSRDRTVVHVVCAPACGTAERAAADFGRTLVQFVDREDSEEEAHTQHTAAAEGRPSGGRMPCCWGRNIR